MILPGFLLILLPVIVCGCDCSLSIIGDNAFLKTFDIIVLLAAIYLVGLLYHRIVEMIFNSCLRNNPDKIRSEAERFYEKYREDGGKASENPSSLHEYYKAYYLVMKNGCLGNVPILETQVAFIRNMLPVMLLYIIALCCCCKLQEALSINPAYPAILLCVAVMLLKPLMFKLQDKIYYLIWESYMYLNEKTEKKN
jgi:hypothetical protein